MKKLKSFLLLTMALSVLAFTGCGNTKGNMNDIGNGTNTPNTTNTTNTASDTANTSDASADTKSTTSFETIESLTQYVDDAVAKTDAAKSTGNTENDKNQYINLEHLLDSVEDKLDAHDDFLETQHNSGTLSYEEYRKKEHALEKLEDKLDSAEDKLEFAFKINE